MAGMLPGAAAGIRDLDGADAPALERFAVLASFPPWALPAGAAAEDPRVRRWVDGWPGPDDLGVGWPAAGALLGAAWARRVEPVLLHDARGGALAEVVVAVDDRARGRGVGTALVAALADRAARRGWSGLALTVSARNPAAISVYRRCGFVAVDDGRATAGGPLTMALDLQADERAQAAW